VTASGVPDERVMNDPCDPADLHRYGE